MFGKFDPFRPSDLGAASGKDRQALEGGVFPVRVVSDRAVILPEPQDKNAKRKLGFKVCAECLEVWEPRCVPLSLLSVMAAT